MGGAAAARRRRRPDGQLRSACAASGLAATAVRAGPTAGLRWRAAAGCGAAFRSPGTGARHGRRTAARAAWHGGCSGESEIYAQLRFTEVEMAITYFTLPIRICCLFLNVFD